MTAGPNYSTSYRRYVTGVLLVAYIFNQIDRGIFGFLMEPIKLELGLTDTQLGFLAGPALVILYAALGIPVARLADRRSRVTIISIALTLWSAVVTLTATVGSFWQFALARVGVGVGEAGFTAVAQSLINDSHPSSERTRAISFFMLGIPLGAAASSLLAGWLNEYFGWRTAFVAAGAPGIVLALLIRATVKEPARAVVNTATAPGHMPPLRQVVATLWSNPVLRHLAIGQGLVNIAASMLGWFAVFFMRAHHMTSGTLGTWLAVMATFGGALGVLLGGHFVGRQSADDLSRMPLMAIATALLAPAILAALWHPDATFALLLLLPLQVLMFFCYGPTFAIVQALSPASMRATTASIFILIQVLGGGVIGVQMLGVLSDVLIPFAGDSANSLRWGMSAAAPLALWAAYHFWRASRAAPPTSLSSVAVASGGA